MSVFEFIKGYENLYKINRNGEIYSCFYGKIMKPQKTEDGYYFVSLRDCDRKRSKCRIHRLLAIQYLPNPDNLAEVDHKDINKTNNSLENLRWVSRETNQQNKNSKGCVYQDVRKNGKIYWKSSYYYFVDGKRIAVQKTSINKEVCENWLKEIKNSHPKIII